MNLDFRNFNLTKVRLIKDGGLDVHWEQTVTNGAITDTEKEHKESTRDPHPDLVAKINTLKPLLAKLWGYNTIKIAINNERFNASPEQEEAGNRAYNELLSDMEVTGVVTRGAGENMAVNITGKRKMYQKIFQVMNSPRIQLNQKLYGFENDLEDLIGEIKWEVYEYLFKGKCANPTLFGEAEQMGYTPESEEEGELQEREVGEPQPEEPNLM